MRQVSIGLEAICSGNQEHSASLCTKPKTPEAFEALSHHPQIPLFFSDIVSNTTSFWVRMSSKLGLGLTLPTLKGNITYSEAADEEHNVLHELTYPRKREAFINYLLEHTKEIEDIVSCYLRLKGGEEPHIVPREFWLHGSFNLCIPVVIKNWRKHPDGGGVMIRFPLSYKVGDLNYPGNSEEKIRCEVATYAWIHENCPDVPIPNLWGFAFTGAALDGKGSSVSEPAIDGRMEIR